MVITPVLIFYFLFFLVKDACLLSSIAFLAWVSEQMPPSNTSLLYVEKIEV
jgi:hypothetical protein